MTKMKSCLRGSIAAVILIGLVSLLAADVSFSLYQPARFTSVLPYCTLSIFSGTVKVQTLNAITWKEAKNGMTLEAGSRVRTLPDSHALLTFFEGTTTKLEPGTDLLVAKLEGNRESHPDVIVLKQWSGKTWNRVTTLSDNSRHFEIQTPSSSAVARGTLFLTKVDRTGRTLIQTTEGQVSVIAQGREVQVLAGQQTEVEPGAPPPFAVQMSPSQNELIVTVSMPAVGMVVDPSGSSTGYLPDGSALNQIAGSRSSMVDQSHHTIRVPELRTGEYTIVLRGVGQGVSRFSIEALTEGKSTFRQAGSCNVTAASEWLLHLHVDVLDGLLKGVSVVKPELPSGQVMAHDAVERTGATEMGPSEITTKPSDNDSRQPPTPGKDQSPNPGWNWTSLWGGYRSSQWAVSVSMIVLAIILAVVWRRH